MNNINNNLSSASSFLVVGDRVSTNKILGSGGSFTRVGSINSNRADTKLQNDLRSSSHCKLEPSKTEPSLNYLSDTVTSGGVYDLIKGSALYLAGKYKDSIKSAVRASLPVLRTFGSSALNCARIVGGAVLGGLSSPAVATGAVVAGATAFLTQTEVGKSALNSINNSFHKAERGFGNFLEGTYKSVSSLFSAN